MSSLITVKESMKAIRIEEYGGPETLRLRNLELPEPGTGEVRVSLRAAGLNFVDVHLRRGEVRAAGPNFVDVSLRHVEYPSYLPLRLVLMARASLVTTSLACTKTR
jgi:hypothetical protein